MAKMRRKVKESVDPDFLLTSSVEEMNEGWMRGLMGDIK